MVNQYKIHRLVEHIKQYRFEFEVMEVEEDLCDILHHYGLGGIDLTAEEHRLLVNELLPLAEEYEIREAEHLAFEKEIMIV